MTGGLTTLSVASTYNGPTTIYGGGTLANGINSALPSGTTVNLGSGTLGIHSGFTNTYNVNGYTQTVAGITSTNGSSGTDANSIVGGTGNGSSTASTLTVTPSGSDTFGGVIGGAGSNQNNLNLTHGRQWYADAHQAPPTPTPARPRSSSGTLNITGSTASTGTVGVSNGGTLSGTGSTGIVTVSGGGSVNLQDGAIDSLTVAGLTTGGSPASTLAFDIKTLSGSTTSRALSPTAATLDAQQLDHD